MKPVAWMVETSDDITFMLNVKGASKPDNSWDKVTPVYTHPAKTLTDEEIQELALCDEFWISEDCTIFDWHKFARAILKKAQGEG
jgi:hypothetical protein